MIRCTKCGWEWESKSIALKVSCPGCGSKVKNRVRARVKQTRHDLVMKQRIKNYVSDVQDRVDQIMGRK